MDIISYVTPERTIDDEPVPYLSEQISDYGFPLRLISGDILFRLKQSRDALPRAFPISVANPLCHAPDAINSRLSINHIFIIL